MYFNLDLFVNRLTKNEGKILNKRYRHVAIKEEANPKFFVALRVAKYNLSL